MRFNQFKSLSFLYIAALAVALVFVVRSADLSNQNFSSDIQQRSLAVIDDPPGDECDEDIECWYQGYGKCPADAWCHSKKTDFSWCGAYNDGRCGEPTPGPTPPPPQCNDNIDNDSDGKCDWDGLGCPGGNTSPDGSCQGDPGGTDESSGPAPAWVELNIANNVGSVNWTLDCPPGSYSCDNMTGTGNQYITNCQNGACAGVGTYTITGTRAGYVCAAGSDFRGAPPPTVKVLQLGVVCNPVTPPATVDLLCNSSQGPCTVNYNTNVTLSWTSANATSCTASNAWTGSKSTSGSESQGPVTSARTYTLQCTGAGGAGPADSVVVQNPPAPTVNLLCNGINGPCEVPYNSNVTLSWTSTNATSCTASNAWSGAKGTSGNEPNGPVNSNRTYTIQCTGTGGTSPADSVTVENPPNATPRPTNVTVDDPDYCASGPAALINWNFTDPNPADTQSQYQVQVDNQSSFTSPEIDQTVLGSANSYLSPAILEWGANYNARLRVWDNAGGVSNWVVATCIADECIGNEQWKVPLHAYPSNIDFTWIPPKPVINESVQFTSLAICYDNNNNPIPCATYNWNWGDGTSLSGNYPNPTHSWSTDGPYTISHSVVDNSGNSCPQRTKIISVQKPIPNWKEVLPR